MNEAESAIAQLDTIRAALAGITGEDQGIEDNIDLIRETLNTRVDVWRKQAAFDWLERTYPHEGMLGPSVEARNLIHHSDHWSCGNNVLGGWHEGSTALDAVEAAMRAESDHGEN